MTTKIIISKSDKKDKKYVAKVNDKNVYFGAVGYSDYILSGGDDKKKQAYIARHKENEKWGITGIETPGFYARWVLWEKPTIQQSIDNLNKKYNYIKFELR
jgi:hypothetical protein